MAAGVVFGANGFAASAAADEAHLRYAAMEGRFARATVSGVDAHEEFDAALAEATSASSALHAMPASVTAMVDAGTIAEHVHAIALLDTFANREPAVAFERSMPRPTDGSTESVFAATAQAEKLVAVGAHDTARALQAADALRAATAYAHTKTGVLARAVVSRTPAFLAARASASAESVAALSAAAADLGTAVETGDGELEGLSGYSAAAAAVTSSHDAAVAAAAAAAAKAAAEQAAAAKRAASRATASKSVGGGTAPPRIDLEARGRELTEEANARWKQYFIDHPFLPSGPSGPLGPVAP
jgi:hypothetical protein